MKNRCSRLQAFTLVELLVVIAIIAVLAAIQLPALANTKAKVQRVNCSGNLKQVGIAFRTWAGKHSDRMPMQVTRANGGASEAVGIARNSAQLWGGGAAPIATGVWGMFLVMSNELNTPKILYCPSEGAQSAANTTPIGPQATAFGPRTAAVEGFQNDANVSYFVGVDANTTRPDMLLTGDHNLGTGANQAIKVSSFISAGTNVNWPAVVVTAIGWQANNHNREGNVTFADGSVQNLTTDQFRAALNKTGDTSRSAGVFATAPNSIGAGVNRLQFP